MTICGTLPPISLVPGDKWDETVNIADENGAALVLSGWTITMAEVRKRGGSVIVGIGDGTLVLDLSGLDEGKIRFTAAAGDTGGLFLGDRSELEIEGYPAGGTPADKKTLYFGPVVGEKIATKNNITVFHMGFQGAPGLLWRGDWLLGAVYAVNDGVYRDGTSYRAKAAHVATADTEPGEGVDWQHVWAVVAQGANAVEVGIVAANIGSIISVAGSISSINTVAGSLDSIEIVAGIGGAVATAAGIAMEIQAVAGIAVQIGIVAAADEAIATVAGSIDAVNLVASNIGGINDVLSAKITWRNAYSGATAYAERDAVRDNGSSWIARTATTGNAPPTLPATENTWWELLAEKGQPGAPGEPLIALVGDAGDTGAGGWWLARDFHAAATLTRCRVEMLKGTAAAAQLYIEKNGAYAAGPFLLDSTAPTIVAGLNIVLGAGDTVAAYRAGGALAGPWLAMVQLDGRS